VPSKLRGGEQKKDEKEGGRLGELGHPLGWGLGGLLGGLNAKKKKNSSNTNRSRSEEERGIFPRGGKKGRKMQKETGLHDTTGARLNTKGENEIERSVD